MESLRESDQRIILGIIACAAFMSTLDSTIVNISLPTISTWFQVDIGGVSWVVIAYLLTLTGLMLTCGRLGDIKGFRSVFIIGFSTFTVSSLLCGLSWSISSLIFFRILQGAGAAAIQALFPAMIALYLPEEKRGWAFGILLTIVSLGIAGGPIIGGYITEFLGWHWIFFINVPIGVVGVLLAMRYIPHDTLSPKPGRLDIIGSILILLALVTLLFPLNQGLYLGWTSYVILGSISASVLLWIIFILYEKRIDTPLIHFRLFDSRQFLFGNIAGMLVILSFAGTEFLLPFYLETVHGFTTEIAGMFLAVPAVFIMVAGPIAGKISDKYGSRNIMIGAAFFASVAMFLYTMFSPDTNIGFMVLTLAIEGCAVGLFMPPNMNLILSSETGEFEGVASGVMMMLRNVGGVIGIALFGTIAMQSILMKFGDHYARALPEEVMSGFQTAFSVGVVVCLMAAGISILIGRHLSDQKV